MPRTRNPIYPRWDDPFFGTSRDSIIEYGDGDFDKGYNKILDNFIERWNKKADKVGLPKTSREHGMEWIPVPDRDSGGWKRAHYDESGKLVIDGEEEQSG
ncbi:MAG: hypothetical protein MPJ22_08505 [Pirellulales bacterium]|nr:hypothetical protein [Pirellulales bacterium]